MSSQHFIIGTAGHIDHGKTSLVRALTGVDLDRLPEERERGITIALGFTHLPLPSGRLAGFVDVPGHERLVRTMIAGATGLDAVVLCVSAVDGVMPQTREHLDILGLLGVAQGVIALTMADLVDAEMLELAMLDVEEAVAGTFLAGAPVIPTAAVADPPQGLDALVAAIDALPVVARSEAGLFRLPVDRAFVRRGFGTVVTGTARSGQIRDGEEVEIQPEGLRARVRGVQVHGKSVEAALAGQRTALNLAGVERDDLARGMVVTRPGTLPPASILDARYRHLPDAVPLEDGARVRLLAGTAEVMAVLSVLDHPEGLLPGQEHSIQLRTEVPLVALPGDRFILRRESPLQTLGGGQVLDPWAPRARRRDYAQAAAELAALSAGRLETFLVRAGEAGLSPDEARRYAVPEDEAVVLGGRWLAPAGIARLEEALLAELDAWHAANPLRPGAPRRDVRRGILQRIPEPLFVALVQRMADAGQIEAEGPVLRRAGFVVRLTAEQQRAHAALEAEIRAAGLEGPQASDLLRQQAELVHLLLDAGAIRRVGPYLMHRTVMDDVVARVQGWLAAHGELGPTDFKELVGLSRKYAIPMLEWLDAEGITRRQGDRRVRGDRSV